ncbi:NACHT and WD domain protein [Cordyceps javanica]|nr:NACHT and WD domain protein [Cordyceps javanica]
MRRPSLVAKQVFEILGQQDHNDENLLFFRDNRVVNDSCNWIFDKVSFKWWADTTAMRPGRYLWLYGPPAAGKSVLMSAVIDRLQSENRLTAFYFFRRNNTAGRSTRSFLLSLVAQMSMQSLEFYERLVEIDAQDAKIHSMPTRVLWQKVFVDTPFEIVNSVECQWYWIIDALDEADAPSELVSLIGKINSRTPVNVIITSRIDMNIKRSLHTFVPKQALQQEQIEPADTRDAMAAHARHKLDSLPFEADEIEQIVELLVSKSQGIFLWVRFAVEEIQATAHTLEGVYEALEAMPSEMADFFEQILDGMSKMRDSNKIIARAILCNTVCAMRPLRTVELQAALHPTFGRLASLDYTIKQVCPHLIKVDEASGLVQLIHETVRDFVLQFKDSEFHVDSFQAHHNLTQICLGVWSENKFASPISSSVHCPRSISELNSIHPLLYYSATSWFDHLQNAIIDKSLELTICDFLRTSVLSWVEAVGLLGDLTLLTAGALGLEASMMQSPLISYADKRLISGWAVDLVRIAPKYGRNIVSYPFSIHRLLPPFCPVKTQIGSRFGAAGDISIVGAGHKHWDDCLAHITVSRDGELCTHLVCGSAYLVVTLSRSAGLAIIYDTETCLELRRIRHGELITAIHMNSTGEYVVTGGLRSMKIWKTKTGQMAAELANPGKSRCLGVAFRPDSKTVIAFTSNDSIAVWDFNQGAIRETRLERPAVQGKYHGSPWGVAFDKDITMISLAYKGWPIEVWDIDRVELIETVPTDYPIGSCFNPHNNDIYGIKHDSTILRFDVKSQKTTQIRLEARVAACNPSGTLLATGDANGVLKFFTADTLEFLYKIDAYGDMVTDLCFSPDGTKLYDIRSSACNVWIPEVPLVSVREDSSMSGVESENSTLSRTTLNVACESSSLVNITVLNSRGIDWRWCWIVHRGSIKNSYPLLFSRQATPHPLAMAVAAVFALPELHEAILYHADMATLLVAAQRVSKSWHHLIAASPTLQQKLFFQPAPGDAHLVASMPVIDQPGAEGDDASATRVLPPPLTRNPLLVKYFSPCFFETHDKAYFRQANSFMTMPWTPKLRKERLDEDGIMRSMELRPREDAYVQPFRQRFFRGGASWRRMLVTQPPLRRLGYLCSSEAVEGVFATREFVAVIRGSCIPADDGSSPSQALRMGRLYDLVQEHVCRHELHCLWFRIHWDGMCEPAYCEASQELGAKLAIQSRIVVEFLAQEYPSNSPKQLGRPEVFDDVFRCDEHEEVKVEATNHDDVRRVAWPGRHRLGMLSRFSAVHDEKNLIRLPDD